MERSRRDILWTSQSGHARFVQSRWRTLCCCLPSRTMASRRCYDTKTGEAEMEGAVAGRYKASPVLVQGRVLFLNTTGTCTVVSASSRFDKLVENQLDDETLASPAIAHEHIYLRGRKTLYCIGRRLPVNATRLKNSSTHATICLVHRHPLEFRQARRAGPVPAALDARGTGLVLMGGDIAEATDVVHYLELLDRHLQRPCTSSWATTTSISVRSAACGTKCVRCVRAADNLVYLTDAGVIELTESVALVGHDGWADARIGNYERSMIMMNDYKLIQELAGVNKEQRWPLLQALGDEAAAVIRRVLPAALDTVRVGVPAHARAAAARSVLVQRRHFQRRMGPHFTCKAVGDAILEIMPDYPQRH